MQYKPDVLITHGDGCDDGFGTAWVARRKWPDVQVMFFNYQDPLIPIMFTGQHVLICDFSFPEDRLKELSQSARSVVVLDHHEKAQHQLSAFQVTIGYGIDRMTAVREYAQLLYEDSLMQQAPGNVIALFDMDRSGAGLMWDFCYPNQPRDPLVQYIENRDLWRLDRFGVKDFTFYLRSHQQDYEVWDHINEGLMHLTMHQDMLSSGADIRRYYETLAESIAENHWTHTIGEYEVPVANCPHVLASDVCRVLMEKTGSNIAATFEAKPDGFKWSVRSADDGPNVNLLCNQFGGGGHPHASGFFEGIPRG